MGAGLMMAGKDKVLMKVLIQKPDSAQKLLKIRGEVLVSIFKERAMDAGIAFHSDESIFPLDGPALCGVSGQKPAGNEVKPAGLWQC